ncbi:hypothetical protein M6D93_04560 [Jatrophihabitans telluris]|uniref:Secreted protein n=1 Tax=Jatrophihabitans telluris TaxID=2038343 RepID=A0ABY4R0J6_9ACTN|nr:hypothetical protein [Jatrophihabitans telluris]UQX89279.1 hypothetical protein M6D93_04560 [Jatrophihabitans telluris]
MTADVIVGVAGALGGGVVASATSFLTLRATHRAERQRWIADREWEHATDVARARREAYSTFLAHENAIIMSAAAVANRQLGRPPLGHMPDDQVPVYQGLQDAYATALLLASASTQAMIIECQQWLDELVWASWKGQDRPMPRDDLHNDVLAAMQRDAVDPPTRGAVEA